MKKAAIIFVGLWLTLNSLFAQAQLGPIALELSERVEALEGRNQPEELLRAYQALASAHFARRHYDTALTLVLNGLDLAESSGLESQSFDLLHLAGCIFFYPLDNYGPSLDYLEQAKLLAETNEVSSPYEIRNLIKLAEVQNATGNVTQAIEIQFAANRLAQAQEDQLSLAMGYRNLGVFYTGQRQLEQAMAYFQEGKALIEAIQGQTIDNEIRHWDRGHTYYNIVASMSGISIGLADMLGEDLALAIAFAERSRQIADSIGHPYGVAYSYGLQGQIYAAQEVPDTALRYLQLAVEIYQDMGLKREWVSFSGSVAKQLLNINNPYRALRWLEEAVKAAEEINAPALQRDIYKMQAQVYEELDNLPLAYESFKRYSLLKDSLQSGSEQLAKLAPEQEVRAKEEEIQSLQAQSETSRRQLIFTIFGFGLLFLLILLYLGYVRNKTLRRINRVLASKNDEIRRQNERLASSNEDLQQFAHVVSHDLREPLRSIGSFATLLQRRYQGSLDRDADEFISFITAGVNRMDTLLSDLMAYSVVGIFKHELEEVDVAEVIQEISANITRERGSLGARINMRNLPTLEADRQQITQLFHHLIDNAIKFRSDAPPEVAIEAIQQGSYYLLSVRDNGIGMDEVYKDKIFGLFLRLNTKKAKYKGTGIGLSICKKIVEQHKGKIWIDSQLGVGTTVYFTLPESPRDDLTLERTYFPRLGKNRAESVG